MTERSYTWIRYIQKYKRHSKQSQADTELPENLNLHFSLYYLYIFVFLILSFMLFWRCVRQVHLHMLLTFEFPLFSFLVHGCLDPLHFPLINSWRLTPSGSFVWSRCSFCFRTFIDVRVSYSLSRYMAFRNLDPFLAGTLDNSIFWTQAVSFVELSSGLRCKLSTKISEFIK